MSNPFETILPLPTIETADELLDVVTSTLAIISQQLTSRTKPTKAKCAALKKAGSVIANFRNDLRFAPAPLLEPTKH